MSHFMGRENELRKLLELKNPKNGEVTYGRIIEFQVDQSSKGIVGGMFRIEILDPFTQQSTIKELSLKDFDALAPEFDSFSEQLFERAKRK